MYIPDGSVLERYLWDRSKLSVIQGPIGSGTSTCSIQRMWLLANEQLPDFDGVRRTSWLVTRETYPLLRESILRTTWPQWFPEEEWGQMVRTEPMSHMLSKPHWSGDGTTTEARVTFLALEHEEAAERILPSMEITGFFMNEGQFTSLAVVVMLLSRTGRYPAKKDGPGPTWFGGFIDLNAPEEGHWIPYMRGDIPVPPDWPEDMRRQFQKPRDWTFHVQPPGLIEKMVDGRIAYEANPAAENLKWLAEPYLGKIEGWDKGRIDRLVLNKVGLTRRGKPVYPTFLSHDHVLSDDMPAHVGIPIVVGMDFGRDPAACFCQLRGETWHVLSEVIGDNESAERFAPRVARHIAQRYPGFQVDFWGDPRGADGNQATEVTAYDIFHARGMKVLPATNDNNPEMRRSTLERVLNRRYGLQINRTCLTLKMGLAGGYHYRAIKGVNGMFTEKPVKNGYSHIVEALENAVLGGGEGRALIRASNIVPLHVGKAPPRRVQWR